MGDWRHEPESWEPDPRAPDEPPAWAVPETDPVESTAWTAPEADPVEQEAWAAPESDPIDEDESYGWLGDDIEAAAEPRGWSFDLQVPEIYPAGEPPVRVSGPGEGVSGEPGGSPEDEELAEEEEERNERRPLLRRKLSFRREPRQRPPKERKEPRRRRTTEAEDAPETTKRPLLKRELSFGRRERKTAVETPEVQTPHPEPTPVRSRPKRELGLGREKRIVGLKIGASQMAAARVVNNGGAHLLQLARGPLEPGIVVGGELRDPDALAEALRDFFRENKLPRRAVRLGIANNRIGVRSFEIVGIDDPKQLENAIRFRAQETLPIPIEEAVVDHRVLAEGVDDSGQTVRRILLVVAYRDLVDRYVEACRKAGIRLVGVDLEAFALLRALAPPREEDQERAEAATVAVALGSDRSIFAVSDGRTCEFTRVLEWGGYALNVAVARALDIAPSEAEPVKRALSLNGTEVPEGLSEEQAEKAREAIRRQVSSFARELVSSLQFYQNQPGSLDLSTIMLTGGTAHLPGIAEELERLTGVAVQVGDPLTRVSVGKKVRTADAQMGSLAVAIGLGIEG